MLINSRAFTLNSNHNNYSGFTAVDPSYVTVNSSKAVGPVTHRNYLALNDRALTTLNANTLLKQNSGYSGALSSYNPYENMNYSNTHSEQPQQTLVANTNFYNTRSKSVSIQKNRVGGFQIKRQYQAVSKKYNLNLKKKNFINGFIPENLKINQYTIKLRHKFQILSQCSGKVSLFIYLF